MGDIHMSLYLWVALQATFFIGAAACSFVAGYLVRSIREDRRRAREQRQTLPKGYPNR